MTVVVLRNVVYLSVRQQDENALDFTLREVRNRCWVSSHVRSAHVGMRACRNQLSRACRCDAATIMRASK